MKITSTITNVTAVIAVLIFAGLGCKPAANTNTSNVASNTTQPATISPATAEPTKAVAETAPATWSLATPSEAYRTAYDLRKRKDVQGLKKIMSPDIIEFLTMMGEGEKKSLDEMIKEMFDKPQADKAEVRNELIKGNMATVEYLTETGDWKTMDFEKIGGDWMLTFPKGESPEPGPKKGK